MVAEQNPIPGSNMAMNDEQVKMLLEGLLAGLGRKGGKEGDGEHIK